MSSPPPDLRRRLFRWLRVLFGLGLLGVLAAQVHPSEYAELVRRGDPAQLALGLGLLFLAFPVLQTLRLHVVVARYVHGLTSTFQVFMVGAFFNTMLPSNVGGDAVRLLYLKRMRAQNWGGPFAMLMLHRASAMGVLLIAAAVHAALNHERLVGVLAGLQLDRAPSVDLPLVALAAVVLCALGWLALKRFARPLVTRLRGFALESLTALREVGWPAASALIALTALFHFVRMLAFYVLVRYMGEHIALIDLLPVLAATALAGVIPLTVGGLGLMEGAISVTLTLFGVGETAAIAAALANRLVLVVSAAIGGVVYVTSGDARKDAP